MAAVAPAPVLAVDGLGFRYREREVLRDVSLAVAPGEIVGLLGPNGSGKSTLLALVAGLLRAAAGTLTYDGRRLAEPDRAARASLGFVFQSPSLDGKLTARENLALAGRMHGLRGAALAERVAAALAAADLADRAAEPVGRLSGGMRRRLDLARATLHGPALLLADEPTTGLDEASFQRTWRQLRALAARRGAVLVSTHRPDEAERCDRLVVLDHGRVVAVDTPQRLKATVDRDRIELEGDDPEALRALVADRCALPARVEGRLVVVDAPRGDEAIVRLVQALPPGHLRAVSLRRPGLGEAFLALTGTALDADEAPALEEAA